MIFLQGVGVSTSLVVRIYKKYGDALPDLLRYFPAAIGLALLVFYVALSAPVRRLRCHLP
jgi:hypothetical protein